MLEFQNDFVIYIYISRNGLRKLEEPADLKSLHHWQAWFYSSLPLKTAKTIIGKSTVPGTFMVCYDPGSPARFYITVLSAPEQVHTSSVFLEDGNYSIKSLKFNSLTQLVNYFHFWAIHDRVSLR